MRTLAPRAKYIIWISIVTLFLFFFSASLMRDTFYKNPDGSFVVASRVWSDFGAHLPLIRSFSFGANWPPESPLFPGEPIRYHYLFYLIVGLLEKSGIPIDQALNALSSFGLITMLLCIYFLSLQWFTSHRIATLAVLFSLFNSSLSFVKFFHDYPLSVQTFSQIWHASQFPQFGPWDGNWVSAFWSLNIYTNQRHLALSYALVLGSILIVEQFEKIPSLAKRISWSLVIGFFMGILLLMNFPALAIGLVMLLTYGLKNVKKNYPLIFGSITFIPWMLLFITTVKAPTSLSFQPGFLTPQPLTIQRFIEYWIHNMGLLLVLSPLGFFIHKRKTAFLILPILIFFIVPNLVQFSPDMINNHKFFNFLFLILSPFAAATLVKIWDGKKPIVLVAMAKVFTLIAIVGMTISGIIEYRVIKNDHPIILPADSDRDVQFFANATAKDAVILNSTWFLHPASLAGRKIAAGYPYFTWSYGYDKDKRETLLTSIYQANSNEEFCRLTRQNNFNFIEVSREPNYPIYPLSPTLLSATPMYENPQTGMKVYDVKSICL